MPHNQNYTIHQTSSEVLRYVEEVRSQPQRDRKTLYEEIVVTPNWANFVSGCEFEKKLSREKITIPPEDTEGFARIAESVRNSEINAVSLQALQKVSEVLPGPDTMLYILPGDPGDSFLSGYMGGVHGAVIGAGRIALVVSPCPGWLDRVPAAIAHEYHHSVWLNLKWKQVSSFDLLNYLIFEGRACCFTQEVFPDIITPYTQALTPEQEAEQWRNMQHHLAEESYEIQAKFMFGCDTVPLCTGYTIGFRIVQSYLRRNPHMTVKEWTVIDARNILDGSGYNPCESTFG